MMGHKAIAEWLVLTALEKRGYLTSGEREGIDRALLGMSIATSAVATRAGYSIVMYAHNALIARGVAKPFSQVYQHQPLAQKPPGSFKMAGMSPPSRPPPGAGIFTLATVAGSSLYQLNRFWSWYQSGQTQVYD